MQGTLTEEFLNPSTLFVGENAFGVIRGDDSEKKRVYLADMDWWNLSIGALCRGHHREVGGILRIAIPFMYENGGSSKKLASDVRGLFNDFATALLKESGPTGSFEYILIGRSSLGGHQALSRAASSTPQFNRRIEDRAPRNAYDLTVDMENKTIMKELVEGRDVAAFMRRNRNLYNAPRREYRDPGLLGLGD